jgi:hypothetical protein
MDSVYQMMPPLLNIRLISLYPFLCQSCAHPGLYNRPLHNLTT